MCGTVRRAAPCRTAPRRTASLLFGTQPPPHCTHPHPLRPARAVLRLELPRGLDKMFGEGDAAEKEEVPQRGKAAAPSLPPSPPSPSLPSAPSLPPSPPSPPPLRSLSPAPRSAPAGAPAFDELLPNCLPQGSGPAKLYFEPASPPDAPSASEEQEWAAGTIHYFARRKEDVGLAMQEARERRAARLIAAFIRRHLTLKRQKEARTLRGRISLFRRRWERPFPTQTHIKPKPGPKTRRSPGENGYSYPNSNPNSHQVGAALPYDSRIVALLAALLPHAV